jgi:hypothetical protein
LYIVRSIHLPETCVNNQLGGSAISKDINSYIMGSSHFFVMCENILVDRRRHSNVLDVQSFGAEVCDSDHCLVVVKVMERLAVNKQRLQRLDMEGFNLKKLNYVEGKEPFGC